MIPSLPIGPRKLLNDCNHSATAKNLEVSNISTQTRGSKRPKARSVFLLDTRGRLIPPLNSPYGGPLAGPRRANTRQHPGPQWENEASSLGGRY